MKLGKMSKKTNNEKLFIPLKNLRKNDVNKHAKDSEEIMTIMSRCKHSSTIKDLME
jgi:hypothetical protein